MSFAVYSQEGKPAVIDYKNAKEYEIGGVKVFGAVNRDNNAIANLSGLIVGKKIQIPGQDIAAAIKNLWKVKLFTDIEIILEKTVGDIAFLEIHLKERPTFSKHSFTGVKKSKHEELNEILTPILVKGGIITDDVKQLAKVKLEDYYIDKGYLDAEIKVKEFPDEEKENTIRLVFDIDQKSRVKIADIIFVGNEKVKSSTLARKMKETKSEQFLFKKSRYISKDYESDKSKLIEYYNKIGYRDAKIKYDTLWRRAEDGKMNIAMVIDEGEVYSFNTIVWKGNSIYTDDVLSSVLGIKKGDIYNKELLEKRLQFSLDGRDVSSLYMDQGYLFFRVEPAEIAVDSNKIDPEKRN